MLRNDDIEGSSPNKFKYFLRKPQYGPPEASTNPQKEREVYRYQRVIEGQKFDPIQTSQKTGYANELGNYMALRNTFSQNIFNQTTGSPKSVSLNMQVPPNSNNIQQQMMQEMHSGYQKMAYDTRDNVPQYQSGNRPDMGASYDQGNLPGRNYGNIAPQDSIDVLKMKSEVKASNNRKLNITDNAINPNEYYRQPKDYYQGVGAYGLTSKSQKIVYERDVFQTSKGIGAGATQTHAIVEQKKLDNAFGGVLHSQHYTDKPYASNLFGGESTFIWDPITHSKVGRPGAEMSPKQIGLKSGNEVMQQYKGY